MADWMETARVVEAALNVAGIVGGVLALWRVPSFADGKAAARTPDPAGLSDVAVVVPARNEERRLPSLLDSLARQRPSGFETVVVDDRSEDATAQVASRAGARLVRPPEPPPGWTGKSWACWNGALSATGRILVFLDADVVLEGEDALSRVVAEFRKRAVDGAFSVQPYHTVVRVYEQLSLFFSLIAVAGMGQSTPAGERLRPLGAYGPCLAIGRETYFAVGGHEAVRSAVHEDIAFGRRLSGAGRPAVCRAGRGAVAFRMYGEGFRSLVEGWSKNFSTGAALVPFPLLLLLVLWLGAGVSLAAWLAFLPDRAVPLALYLLYAAALWRSSRLIGDFRPWVCLLYPVPLLFFLGVFLHSLRMRAFGGRVRWKGRVIDVRADDRRDDRWKEDGT
jgi:4,4'-diaponeurosporenoate glycosyltransferase